MELSNFKIKDPNAIFKSDVDLLWLNNKNTITDFKLNLINSTFAGFSEEENILMEKSWKNLEERSKILFPAEGPFSFVIQKDFRWEGLKNNDYSSGIINVSEGIDYKMITSIRSNEDIYNKIGIEKSPKAFVVVNIMISSDNKIILGKRKFYGDWPSDTYECPGAFIHEKDLEINSLIESAKIKILDDYQLSDSDIKTIPFVIYYVPRILEVVLVCISKVNISS